MKYEAEQHGKAQHAAVKSGPVMYEPVKPRVVKYEAVKHAAANHVSVRHGSVVNEPAKHRVVKNKAAYSMGLRCMKNKACSSEARSHVV